MEKKERIAAFIESLEGEQMVENSVILGGANGGGDGLMDVTNGGDCTNSKATCKGSKNGGDCKNAGYNCADSKNDGSCSDTLDPKPQPVVSQPICTPTVANC